MKKPIGLFWKAYRGILSSLKERRISVVPVNPHYKELFAITASNKNRTREGGCGSCVRFKPMPKNNE
jgi:hypothetical protein